VPSCSSCVMRSCARVCRLSAASIHATSTLASRTHSAIVEMRAVFESVSTEGDDTLQVVQTLPDRRLPAFVRRPWPPDDSTPPGREFDPQDSELPVLWPALLYVRAVWPSTSKRRPVFDEEQTVQRPVVATDRIRAR